MKNVVIFADRDSAELEKILADNEELNVRTIGIDDIKEAQKYNPYLAYSGAGYIYDPDNITQQLEYLKKEVEQAILLLRDTN